MSGVLCILTKLKTSQIIFDAPVVIGKINMSSNTFNAIKTINTIKTVTAINTVKTVDIVNTVNTVNTVSVNVANTVNTVQIANPYFIAGSGVKYAAMAKATAITATTFPSVTSITPAVSCAGMASASSASITAAAVAASVLPILALGGGVAFTAALLTDAFRNHVEGKRRASFLQELAEIVSAVKTRSAIYSESEYEKFSEMKETVSKIKQLEHGLSELTASIAGDEDVLTTGVKLGWAREIAENLRNFETELAYLKYKKISELDIRAASIQKFKNEIIEKMSAIAGSAPEAAEIIKAAEKIDLKRIPALQTAGAGAEKLIELTETIAADENMIRAISVNALKLIENSDLDKMLADNFKRALTIDDMGKRHSEAEPEITVVDKINLLLAELLFIEDNSEYSEVLKKFDGIKIERDAERRLMLYDDFVIFCEGLLIKECLRIRTRGDLFEMKRQLMCLGTPRALELAGEIGSMDPSGGPIDMQAVKVRITSAVEEDSARWESDSCAKALRSAFEELGYETDDDFETILITEKKAYIHKPSMKDYHIQLLANPEKNMLQVEIVRDVESGRQADESSRSQETRDIEVQTEFCGDYEKVVEKLEGRGVEIIEKSRKKPGEIKVKKVVNLSGARRKTQKTDGATGLERKIKP